MTYIDYINYFWRMDEALGFTLAETKLFFKLLDIGNKLNWSQKKLMIPMKRLMLSMNCSKNTVLKARKRLCECGLIAVQPGDRNKQAACYRIICDYQKKTKQAHEDDCMIRSCDKRNHERSDERSYEQSDELDTDFSEKGNEDEQKKEHTCEQRNEQTNERENEQTRDPYIRLDKDQDKDQKRMMINDPHGQLSHEKIVDLFHQNCPALKKVKKLTHDLRKKITERSTDFKTQEDWESYFQKAAQSDFLCGKNKYHWQADFKWLIKDAQTAEKILNGKYNQHQKKKKNNWQELFGVNHDGYDLVRGIYSKDFFETPFTNDNQLASAWAG